MSNADKTIAIMVLVLCVAMGLFFGAAFASMIFGTSVLSIIIGAMVGFAVFPCAPIAYLWWHDGGGSWR